MKIEVADMLQNSFVISVNEQRRAQFCQAFNSYNLSPLPKLFNGFTIPNGIYKDSGIIKTSNVCNCLISHVAIVKMAQSLNWPFVCIFEDDAWPCKNIADKLGKVLSHLPDQIDLLKFGHFGSLKDVQQYDENFSIIQTYGSHAYIVFKHYYDRYVDLSKKDLHIDRLAMNSSKGYLVLSTNEMLFAQNDFRLKDTIHDNSMYHHLLRNQGWLKDFDFNMT